MTDEKKQKEERFVQLAESIATSAFLPWSIISAACEEVDQQAKRVALVLMNPELDAVIDALEWIKSKADKRPIGKLKDYQTFFHEKMKTLVFNFPADKNKWMSYLVTMYDKVMALKLELTLQKTATELLKNTDKAVHLLYVFGSGKKVASWHVTQGFYSKAEETEKDTKATIDALANECKVLRCDTPSNPAWTDILMVSWRWGKQVARNPNYNNTELTTAAAIWHAHIDNCRHCASTEYTLRVCKGCHSARYCSKACRTADWRSTHKHECQMEKAVALYVLSNSQRIPTK